MAGEGELPEPRPPDAGPNGAASPAACATPSAAGAGPPVAHGPPPPPEVVPPPASLLPPGPPPPGPQAPRYPGGFLPGYAPPAARVPAGPPPVSEAVAAIPLRIPALLRQSLDLLTRRDAGLRGPSLYIGLVLLVTFGAFAVILGLLVTEPATGPAFDPGAPPFGSSRSDALAGWMLLALLPGLLGYLAAGAEARALATAVLGGRVEGRPLRLAESIAVARRRFWPILGAQLAIGFVAAIASWILQFGMLVVIGPVTEVTFGLSLLVSVAISFPFVYVPAGIVLGEVGIGDAIARSWSLVRLRPRLGLVVAAFSVLGQFIVLFGLSSGLDMVARVMIGAGVVEDFPRPLVVPVAAVIVFALGTLTFLVEAIAAAPAVHAFAALTHYTHGLQVGRDAPAASRNLFQPWFTPGLAAATIVALLALAGAIAEVAR